jgi:hypothetical protein
VKFRRPTRQRKTNHLQIVIFGLQRAAGPYRWARRGQSITASAAVNDVAGNTSPGDVARPNHHLVQRISGHWREECKPAMQNATLCDITSQGRS